MRRQVTLAFKERQRLERIWIEARWRRYANDPELFMADCVWVPDQNSPNGRSQFLLFDYQQEDLAKFRTERYLVVLKARQLGLTTLSMAYALWLLMFRPGSNIVLVSKDQPTANKALELLDFMWRFLPTWAKQRAPKQVNDAATEHQWEFPDGMKSRIISRPATKTVAAGETATLVLWDEAALAPYQTDTLRTLMPTTDAGGSMIVFSTARGGHNEFARLYREAAAGRSEFVAVFHPWWVSRLMNSRADRVAVCKTVPCQECVDWSKYRARQRQFKAEPWKLFSEYPSSAEEAFRQSGRLRFGDMPDEAEFPDDWWRGRLESPGTGQYLLVEDPEGPLRIDKVWLEGVPAEAKPVLAIDPATGSGGDFTAFTLGWLDEEGTPVRAAFWHSNQIEPVVAARDAAILGRWANQAKPALIVVEKQGGYGDTFINELSNVLMYPNMYIHRYTGHRQRKLDQQIGFPMTPARRPLVIDRLAEWLPDTKDPESPHMLGIDRLLRQELGAFVVKDDGKVEADVGMHDDLVMSTAIWLWVTVERSSPATPRPAGEAPPRPTHTVAHIFEEAERVHRNLERQRRREGRQLARAMRRHARTR